MDLPQLRKLYFEAFGKKPFGGWNAEKILAKLEGVKAETPTETPTEPTPESLPEFTKEKGDQVLDDLWSKLNDGRYRRAVMDAKELAITDKEVFKTELVKLYSLVYEGELKGIIRKYIESII